MAPSVRASFDIGALGLLLTVMWTVATTRERPPEHIGGGPARNCRPIDRSRRSKFMRRGAAWVAAGAGIALLDAVSAQRREGYLLAATIALFGAFHWLAAQSAKEGRNPLVTIATEVIGMPRAMRRLALVQFFTWFGLFALWVYAVPAIAERFYGNPAAGTLRYEGAANWVGILFAAYNGVAALAALTLPAIAARIGRRRTHALCLVAGAVGLAGFVAAPDPRLLWVSVFAIGCAWASILAIPYAIVAAVVPPERMGIYMGIHNVFLVLPQLAGAALLGPFVDSVLHGHTAGVFLVGACAMLVASAFTLTIPAID